jgi:hypothetical protein
MKILNKKIPMYNWWYNDKYIAFDRIQMYDYINGKFNRTKYSVLFNKSMENEFEDFKICLPIKHEIKRLIK